MTLNVAQIHPTPYSSFLLSPLWSCLCPWHGNSCPVTVHPLQVRMESCGRIRSAPWQLSCWPNLRRTLQQHRRAARWEMDHLNDSVLKALSFPSFNCLSFPFLFFISFPFLFFSFPFLSFPFTSSISFLWPSLPPCISLMRAHLIHPPILLSLLPPPHSLFQMRRMMWKRRRRRDKTLVLQSLKTSCLLLLLLRLPPTQSGRYASLWAIAIS